MKYRRFLVVTLTSVLAALKTASPVAIQEPASQVIAHYPLTGDVNDATGNHPPLQASGAPIVPGKGIFCNGEPLRPAGGGCDVRTESLPGLNLSAFTVSAEFFVSRLRTPANPVFVGGQTFRWVYAELRSEGVVRLGYNNNQSVDCSVKYRLGVWHEITVTFDGRALALYLDGVLGCSANVVLNTGNQRVVLLTNTGNATAFNGVLRNLKIFNGVAVPARRAPLADSFPEPSPANLAPVDLVLMRCPTRAEIASVDTDLRLSFAFDPTEGEPRACSTAEGSRDLSPMKKRVYNTLLLMRQLQFDRPLPWTRDSLYRWFTHAVNGISFRPDITNSSCCGPGRTLNIAPANLILRHTDRWVEPALGGGLNTFLLLLAHEARHADGHPHTCGSKDRTPDELGAWGVQYYLARWLIEHTDQSFFTSGTIRYNELLARSTEMLRTTAFCTPSDRN
jgi:hypothetical protein